MATSLHRIAVVAAAAVAASLSLTTPAGAQSMAARTTTLDVRAFMPGLRHVEYGAPIERSRDRLTTEERMETALRDRKRGALRSAGEAADVHAPPPDSVMGAPAAAMPTPVASRSADKPS